MNDLSPSFGFVIFVVFCLWSLAMVWMSRHHRHTWKPKGVTNYKHSTWVAGTPIEKGDTTEVLYVCTTCGKSKTKTLNGVWYKEDLAHD